MKEMDFQTTAHADVPGVACCNKARFIMDGWVTERFLTRVLNGRGGREGGAGGRGGCEDNTVEINSINVTLSAVGRHT